MHAEVLLACVAVVALVALYGRDAARQKRDRGQFFADCLHLFERYRVEQEGNSYPSLRGTYRGRTVQLEPIIDHLAWRKLPVLWLQVTVLQPTRFRGVLDFMARATGAEYFSHIYNLQHRLELPAAWPQEAILYSDDPEGLMPLEALHPHLALFSDTKLKELVVSPHGARLVWRVDEASRAHYASFREIRFASTLLQQAVARQVLDAAIALADTVSVEEPQRKVA
jgi:hypothetical protein